MQKKRKQHFDRTKKALAQSCSTRDIEAIAKYYDSMKDRPMPNGSKWIVGIDRRIKITATRPKESA